jgi:hypothetical protein
MKRRDYAPPRATPLLSKIDARLLGSGRADGW